MKSAVFMVFFMISNLAFAQEKRGCLRFFFRPGSDIRRQFQPLTDAPKPQSYEEGIAKTFRRSDNATFALGIGYVTPKSWEFGLCYGYRSDYSYGFSDLYFLSRNPGFNLDKVSKYGGAQKGILVSNWAMVNMGRQFRTSRFYVKPYLELGFGTIKMQGAAAYLKSVEVNYFILDHTSISFKRNLATSIGCEAGIFVLRDVLYFAVSPAFNAVYHAYNFRFEQADMLRKSAFTHSSNSYLGTRLMIQVCFGIQAKL